MTCQVFVQINTQWFITNLKHTYFNLINIWLAREINVKRDVYLFT